MADSDLLEQAEAAFQEGVGSRASPGEARPLFRRAAGFYEALQQRGYDNTDLDRNLGNAYLLSGDLPRAILAYRHGLRLAPADRELGQNLDYARNQVAYPTADRLGHPAPATWARLAAWLGTPSLIAASLCYLAGCLAFARWLARRPQSVPWAAIALVVVAALAGAFWFWEVRPQEAAARPLAVIARDGVQLRVGNGRSYPARYETPLNRGVEARVLFERGDWLQLELSGGEIGWVPRADVVVDSS
jgi:hypothetical protein